MPPSREAALVAGGGWYVEVAGLRREHLRLRLRSGVGEVGGVSLTGGLAPAGMLGPAAAPGTDAVRSTRLRGQGGVRGAGERYPTHLGDASHRRPLQRQIAAPPRRREPPTPLKHHPS